MRSNRARSMLADIELTGVVPDDHGVGEEAVRLDAVPERRLGGDRHGVWIDLERRDAERFEVGVPGVVTGKAGFGMRDQTCVMGLEGIVSKRLSAPYRSGPSRDRLKVKNPDSRR
jgi:hypothetical protein